MPPDLTELRAAAAAFAIDARCAAAIATRRQVTPLEQQVLLRIAARAGDFLLDQANQCDGK